MTNPTSSGEDFGRINEPEGSFGDSNKDSSTDQPFRKRGATMPSSAYGQRPGRSQRVNDDHFTLSSSGQSSNDDIQEFDCGAARRYYRLRSYSVTGRVVSRCGEVLRSRPLHERMGYGINLTPLAARSAGLQSTARCLVRTMSHGSSSSDKSSTDSAIPFTSRYQVAVLGGPAVGKRSLISQFISSDYDRNSGPDVLECE